MKLFHLKCSVVSRSKRQHINFILFYDIAATAAGIYYYIEQCFSNCGPHTTGVICGNSSCGPRTVSEVKALQKLYHTLNK